mgnify:CR=1 FL=1
MSPRIRWPNSLCHYTIAYLIPQRYAFIPILYGSLEVGSKSERLMALALDRCPKEMEGA